MLFKILWFKCSELVCQNSRAWRLRFSLGRTWTSENTIQSHCYLFLQNYILWRQFQVDHNLPNLAVSALVMITEAYVYRFMWCYVTGIFIYTISTVHNPDNQNYIQRARRFKWSELVCQDWRAWRLRFSLGRTWTSENTIQSHCYLFLQNYIKWRNSRVS